MVSPQLASRAARVCEGGDELAERFARAISPSPMVLFPAQEPDQTVFWINRPESGRLSGLIFSD
eukprot:9219616-Pyramimonas_sp.AAC.1